MSTGGRSSGARERGLHRGSGGDASSGHGSFRGGRGGSRGALGRGPYSAIPDGNIPRPDTAVTGVEDALQADKATPFLNELNLEHALPQRPGYGTRGVPLTLWANYVELVASPNLKLYRYDISVSPSATGRKLIQVIRLLLQAPALTALRQDIVSDFKAILLSRQKLSEDDINISLRYRAEGEDELRENATEYGVRLRYTSALTAAELTEYLTSTDVTANYANKLPMIQAFNIIVKDYSKSSGDLVAIGSSKTFSLSQSSAARDLGAGLTAMRGFFASVRAATCRILVNVNVSHGAFYQEGPLDQLILRFDPHLRGKTRIEAFLKRLRVRTTHLAEKKNKSGEVIHRIKTIFGVATPNDGQGLVHPPRVREYGAGPKHVEFWLDTPTQIEPSIREETSAGTKKKRNQSKGVIPGDPSASTTSGRYTTYGVHIMNPDIPVVNAGTREKPTYLPPEVCVVLQGQTAKSRLNSGQTQQMIRFTVRKPWENATSIVQEGLKTAGLSPQTNSLLDQFGISVLPSLVTVPGRLLDQPKVVYKQNKPAVRFGSWNMANMQFNIAGSLKKWSYLLISLPGYRDAFDASSLAAVIQSFGSTLKAAGIVVNPPMKGQRLVLSSPDDAQLDQLLQKAALALDLLLIVLPDSNTPVYNRVKHCGDSKYGIHTICVVGYKLAKTIGQDQYFTNVALKVNLKLGGNNQLVDSSRLGILSEDRTMVVGIDVTHPSPGSSRHAPSIAGMVASVDRWLGQWPAVLQIQSEARQEMVSGLTDMLKSRLRLWKDIGKHQALPENILVYRDGVSEGQYQKVIDKELPLRRKACEEMYPPAVQKKGFPRFTIVIVGKRHHTRFYPTREADADRSSNPKPGTIVDRGVTQARNWDFFLQAHAAIQGTARPAHYFVVLDEIFRNRYRTIPPPFQNVADLLEDLTQSMCYIYGRATKAVSICTPAYYADILCERARCYLSGVFDTPTYSTALSMASSTQGPPVGNKDLRIHPKLRDSMFYI
ncbi:putative RNA interference and gene silencing protein [Colletotrichum cereale]|nr:putative RNA interference and gene silencing protein [Colletotrichum cereale]